MKVLLVNSSPRIDGCTNRALMEIKTELEKMNIFSYILWLGVNPPHCENCRYCKTHGLCKHEGIVNHLLCQMKMYDAVIFGTPVYYGGITSQLSAVLTQVFYSDPKCLQNKPVAGVFLSRRAGSTSAMSQFNLYFLMHNCNIVGSQYWNEVHGDTPSEVELDTEGLQTMRTLAHNIVFAVDGTVPKYEPKVHTNFISREYLSLLKNSK